MQKLLLVTSVVLLTIVYVGYPEADSHDCTNKQALENCQDHILSQNSSIRAASRLLVQLMQLYASCRTMLQLTIVAHNMLESIPFLQALHFLSVEECLCTVSSSQIHADTFVCLLWLELVG